MTTSFGQGSREVFARKRHFPSIRQKRTWASFSRDRHLFHHGRVIGFWLVGLHPAASSAHGGHSAAYSCAQFVSQSPNPTWAVYQAEAVSSENPRCRLEWHAGRAI